MLCYKVVCLFLCGVFFLWLITVVCFVCVAFFNMFNKLFFIIFFCVFLSKDIFQCHSNIKSKIHLKYRFIHWREEEEQPTMEKYCGVLLLLSLLPYCCCSCWCVLWRIVLPYGWGQHQNMYREERVNCFWFSFLFFCWRSRCLICLKKRDSLFGEWQKEFVKDLLFFLRNLSQIYFCFIFFNENISL